jgi:hypothetical protein
MNVRITAAERDALYEQIAVRLSGIDDVWMAVEAEDYPKAERVAREFSDDLRLILQTQRVLETWPARAGGAGR